MRTHEPGYTLTELTLVLLLLSLIAALAFPTLLHARHVIAVNAARRELAASIAVARSTAIVAGGASVVIDLMTGEVRVETATGATIGEPRLLRASHGVALTADRASPVVLRFDALGIGRLTNATVHVLRGGVRASLTVSAYGRVRL